MTIEGTSMTLFVFFAVKCRNEESWLNTRVKKAEKFFLASLLKLIVSSYLLFITTQVYNPVSPLSGGNVSMWAI